MWKYAWNGSTRKERFEKKRNVTGRGNVCAVIPPGTTRNVHGSEVVRLKSRRESLKYSSMITSDIQAT